MTSIGEGSETGASRKLICYMWEQPMTMDLRKLRFLSDRYFEWLEDRTIYVSPELEGYSPTPALTEEFVSYAAVPIKLFTKQEFVEIERALGTGGSNTQEHDYALYLYRVLMARFQNITNEKIQNDVNLVSIGGNCVPRLIFSKWGLRKTRALGARSLPFDLVWCEPDGVSEILMTNFESMVDPALLSAATKQDVREDWKWFVGEVPIAVDNTNSICFNHEAGDFWLKNNYENLISRYRTRIRRFHDIIENGKPTIAVMNYQRPLTRDSYDKLLRGIGRLSSQSAGDLHVACIVSAGDKNEYNRSRTIEINDRLRLTISFNAQPPHPYLFYMPSSYCSAAGLAWETDFLRVLEPVIEREAGERISVGLV